MLTRAFAVIVRRPSVWGPAFGCALLLALVPALAGALGAVPLVALLLTWDPEVMVELIPDVSPAGYGALAALAIVGYVLWRRLDPVLIYNSVDRDPRGWEATRRSWIPVAVLHVVAAAAVAGIAAILTVAMLAGGDSLAGGEALLLLAIVLLIRTVVKVHVTLASRFVIFDQKGITDAWKDTRALVRREKAQIVMAWMTLAAAGASIWLLGPLATPVLRDTAYDYPAGSSHAVAWEGARLVIAVPLEALLLVVSAVVWSSVAWNPERELPAEPPKSSWRVRILAGTAALVILTNGVATAVDVDREQEVTRLEESTERAEIRPEDVRRERPRARGAAPQRYSVEAELVRDRLEWTTRLTYRNTTGVPLEEIVLSVWPAAYARELEDIPLASDLIAADISGSYQSRMDPGTFDVVSVRARDSVAPFELRDTHLTIFLGASRLLPGAVVDLEVALEARLPDFPERFGRWEGMTLLGNWIPTLAPFTSEWRRDRFGDVGDPFVSELADYRVALEVDDDLGVVGSGHLVALEDRGEGTRTWSFEAAQARDAAFAIAPFLRGLEIQVGPTTLRCWYPAEERREVRGDCSSARSALAYYSGSYGVLPFDEVELIETDGMLGGMEHSGMMFISRSPGGLEGVPLLGDLFGYAGFRAATVRHVIGHEMAHQWWYAAVGNDQVREPWLDEALAEASTRLWLQSRGDEMTWKMANLSDGPTVDRASIRASVADFGSNAEYLRSVYEGGSELLLRLRKRIGARSFETILRRWYETQRSSQGTIDEFLTIVERVAGRDAAAYLSD